MKIFEKSIREKDGVRIYMADVNGEEKRLQILQES